MFGSDFKDCYDDRVEITNAGTFPADLPVERLLQEHDSKPQNPIIANVLYKSKILESWGRGISTMVDECKRVGLLAPEFKTDGNFVTVVFKYKRSSVEVTPQLAHSNPTSTQQVPNKLSITTPQLPHSYPTVTPQLRKIMLAIGKNVLSAKEMMQVVNLKDKTNFLEKYLYPAIEQGLVGQLYPDNPKHPKQKYMLTEKGRAILEK